MTRVCFVRLEIRFCGTDRGKKSASLAIVKDTNVTAQSDKMTVIIQIQLNTLCEVERNVILSMLDILVSVLINKILKLTWRF